MRKSLTIVLTIFSGRRQHRDSSLSLCNIKLALLVAPEPTSSGPTFTHQLAWVRRAQASGLRQP
eukprot:756900-Pyramimonas_sp.AAC.1